MVDITDSIDMSLGKVWEIVKEKQTGHVQSVGLQRVGHDQTTKK